MFCKAVFCKASSTRCNKAILGSSIKSLNSFAKFFLLELIHIITVLGKHYVSCSKSE